MQSPLRDVAALGNRLRPRNGKNPTRLSFPDRFERNHSLDQILKADSYLLSLIDDVPFRADALFNALRSVDSHQSSAVSWAATRSPRPAPEQYPCIAGIA
jgi:hypothetical protein